MLTIRTKVAACAVIVVVICLGVSVQGRQTSPDYRLVSDSEASALCGAACTNLLFELPGCVCQSSPAQYVTSGFGPINVTPQPCFVGQQSCGGYFVVTGCDGY
jgi:hypothetical protein